MPGSWEITSWCSSHGMHRDRSSGQLFENLAPDEATGTGNEQSHGVKSSKAASRPEMTAGATGHSMPKAGSFQRTPRANSA